MSQDDFGPFFQNMIKVKQSKPKSSKKRSTFNMVTDAQRVDLLFDH